MISLEMAKKLKEAGLEWEPQRGDWYYFGDDGELHIYRGASLEAKTPEGLYFTPRLDQLLAEISKTGWKWILFGTGGIWLENDSGAMEIIHDGPLEEGCLTELTGEALLWIYEGRATRE